MRIFRHAYELYNRFFEMFGRIIVFPELDSLGSSQGIANLFSSGRFRG
jgi:hypothetical protein